MPNEKLFIDMALAAWDTYIERTNKFLDKLSDEQLSREIAPGKNRLIYLLGHLIAVHDRLLQLFEIGDRQYANLDEPFVNKPDKAVNDIPDASTLRGYWKQQNEMLSKKFREITIENWFSKHTAVSAEDFVKEPVRNKLNVLLNRTNHLSYHYGQMILVNT